MGRRNPEREVWRMQVSEGVAGYEAEQEGWLHGDPLRKQCGAEEAPVALAPSGRRSSPHCECVGGTGALRRNEH